MNNMKSGLVMLLMAVMPVLSFAQETILIHTREITEVQNDEGDMLLSILDMPDGETHNYYLSVGSLGIGMTYVELQVDPIFRLFVPLGSTLKEAQAKLTEFKKVAGHQNGWKIETMGTLSLSLPTVGELETVTVTSRRILLQRIIEFSVRREGSVRASHVAKSDFGSLISSLKRYRRQHPEEA